MTYFVYYTLGRCADGDHENGLAVCKTLKESEQFVAELMQRRGSSEPTCTIIFGREIKTVDWESCDKHWLK